MAEAETPMGAIARAARIPGVLAEAAGDLPLADVAHASGGSTSTAHRILDDPIDAALAAAWCRA